MSRDAELRANQRKDWDLTAPGWKKWDQYLMQWLRPVGDKMLDLSNLEDGDIVLDVATGSGEPGLAAAKMVGRGRVIGIDISEEMVSTAREKAKSLGVANYEARVYSSTRFPFDSKYFDAVICRFGVMFFPDVLGGLREMVRVLKQRGKLCVAVWAPQDERLKNVMQTMMRELGLPPPSPDTPNPFSCSESGKITSLMRAAGLRDVEQVELEVPRVYTSPAQYWEFLLDMNATLRNAFKKAGEEKREVARRGVNEILASARRGKGELLFKAVAWINHGIK